MTTQFSRPWLILGFIIPILCLTLLTLNHHWQRMHGTTVTLPVKGYDPRNLLAGHYVIYRVDYGMVVSCITPQRAVMCLNHNKDNKWQGALLKEGVDPTLTRCAAFIKGTCNANLFTADIERFYIPERFAAQLDKAVRGDQGQVVLKVSPSGKAVVTDLLIEGRSWRDYVSS